MEWVDGVKLTDANGIRGLGEVHFENSQVISSGDGRFFHLIGKVRESFRKVWDPLPVISRVVTPLIGIITPVNPY